MITIENADATIDGVLWGANSYSSHKSQRDPSLVIHDALVTIIQ